MSAKESRKRHLPYREALATEIRFWKQVFTRLSKNQYLFHDSRDLSIVYTVVTLDSTLSERVRSRRLKAVKRKIKNLLVKFHQTPPDSLQLTDWERRIYQQFAHHRERDKFLKASRRIRVQQGIRENFLAGVHRSHAYLPHIELIFKEEGLPRELIYLPHVESSFNPRAVSHVGAAGMWQFMRRTARSYMKVNRVVDQRFDPLVSTRAAARMLKYNYRKLGDWALAITAYNHGLRSMQRAKRRYGKDYMVIRENYLRRSFGFASKNFYPEFLAVVEIMDSLEYYFPEIKKHPVLEFQEIRLPRRVYLPRLARQFHLDVTELRRLNPGYRRLVWRGVRSVPRGYPLRLPLTVNAEAILLALGAPEEAVRNIVLAHKEPDTGELVVETLGERLLRNLAVQQALHTLRPGLADAGTAFRLSGDSLKEFRVAGTSVEPVMVMVGNAASGGSSERISPDSPLKPGVIPLPESALALEALPPVSVSPGMPVAENAVPGKEPSQEALPLPESGAEVGISKPGVAEAIHSPATSMALSQIEIAGVAPIGEAPVLESPEGFVPDAGAPEAKPGIIGGRRVVEPVPVAATVAVVEQEEKPIPAEIPQAVASTKRAGDPELLAELPPPGNPKEKPGVNATSAEMRSGEALLENEFTVFLPRSPVMVETSDSGAAPEAGATPRPGIKPGISGDSGYPLLAASSPVDWTPEPSLTAQMMAAGPAGSAVPPPNDRPATAPGEYGDWMMVSLTAGEEVELSYSRILQLLLERLGVQDGQVVVYPQETVGHFADWLEIPTNRLRRINRLSPREKIYTGQRLRLDFSRVSEEEFVQKRLQYHRNILREWLQDATAVKLVAHRIRPGENLWNLAHRRYNFPVNLLLYFNDLDKLERLYPGDIINVPTIQYPSSNRRRAYED